MDLGISTLARMASLETQDAVFSARTKEAIVLHLPLLDLS